MSEYFAILDSVCVCLSPLVFGIQCVSEYSAIRDSAYVYHSDTLFWDPLWQQAPADGVASVISNNPHHAPGIRCKEA